MHIIPHNTWDNNVKFLFGDEIKLNKVWKKAEGDTPYKGRTIFAKSVKEKFMLHYKISRMASNKEVTKSGKDKHWCE